jgi:4a-hydroxytetrahydrobiopterin dehydratase
MMSNTLLRPLSDAEIEAALESPTLSKWGYDGKALVRDYDTGGWKATMMIANAIAHICELAWHHPEITLSYQHVTVKLNTHDVNGISMRDIECAERIESFTSWKPDASTSALEGVPNADPRFTYLHSR